MDSSFTIKPRDRVARTAVGRGNIVRTDLSPSQSVNAAQQAAASHQTPNAAVRDPSIDPRCHTLRPRVVEDRERRRARKDEALMRQKAYGRKAEQTEAEDIPHADFQI